MPVQLISIADDGRLELDYQALVELLATAGGESRQLPMAVVSICGAKRTGKSTLLSFLTSALLAKKQRGRYGGSKPTHSSEPASITVEPTSSGSEPASITVEPTSISEPTSFVDLTNFVKPTIQEEEHFVAGWGRQPITQGIWASDKLLPVKFRNGQAGWLMLLDTQGLFDSKLSEFSSMRLFALSLLVSSVQLFNVSKQIQEDNLQQAALFSSFARLVDRSQISPGNDEGSHKFFQTLHFIVRDWQFDEGDGQSPDDYLREILAPRPGLNDLNETREALLSSFTNLRCTLLPHPGLQATRKDFDNKISSTTPEFQFAMQQLTERVLESATSSPKVIGHEPVTVETIGLYFESFCVELNSPKIPSPLTLFCATSMINNSIAFKAAFDKYQSYSRHDVSFHDAAMEKALDLFDTKASFGPRDLVRSRIFQLGE